MSIKELVNRPAVYVFEDGVMELAIGLVCIASLVTYSSHAFRTLPILVPQMLWGAICFGIFWGAKNLRERITSPRGGYVVLEECPVTVRGKIRIPQRALNIVLMFAMAGFIAFVRDVFTFPASRAMACSAIFVAAYAFGGIKYHIPHMLGLAAFSVLLATWVYLRNESQADSLIFVIAGQGIALAIAGCTRLWRFLKSHPTPGETEA